MEDLSLSETIDQLGEGFTSFKDRINERIDALELKAGRRLPVPSNEAKDVAEREEEHKAFFHFLRTGDRSLVSQAEAKDMSIGGTNAGGATVPEYLSRNIATELLNESPLAGLVMTEPVDTADIRIPVNERGTGYSWVGETGPRTEDATPVIRSVAPTSGGLKSLVQATQWIARDSFLNLEGWLISEVAAEHAIGLDVAIVSGTGTDQPTGFLSGTPETADDSARTFGELQYVPSGSASAIPHDPATSVHGGDALLDVIDALRVPYRRDAMWVMNRTTRTVIAKWKDADEKHVLTPGMGGQPDSLFGYPVVISEAMPDIGADVFPIAFGDLRKAYRLLPIGTPYVVVDPYTTKGMLEIWYEQRYAGTLVDDNALKLLRVATS